MTRNVKIWYNDNIVNKTTLSFLKKEIKKMENKPICYVPGREIPEVFSGVPCFLGLPKIN